MCAIIFLVKYFLDFEYCSSSSRFQRKVYDIYAKTCQITYTIIVMFYCHSNDAVVMPTTTTTTTTTTSTSTTTTTTTQAPVTVMFWSTE